jgi:membrane-bound serine protease (ClpP class)
MKALFRHILLVVPCLLLTAGGLTAQFEDAEVIEPTVRAVVIPCKDMIDDGLHKSIKRRTQIALDEGADYLIFDIDTYGGDLMAALEIFNHLMLDVNARAHTVAYVSKKAISAGALISVACEDVIMREKTQIGDCAPIMLGGKLEGVEREKIESPTRSAFENAAEANRYPEALLKAMVSQQIEVHRVKNTKTGEYEFFETEDLPKDANGYDLDNKELVVKEGELLTLTASKAEEYGVARTQVKDLQGALDFLAERDGVTFAGDPVVLPTMWSEEMVRWLNHPAVMSILVMLALLGVYIEFNTPGVGLPGLVAVICFAVIIGSRYLTGLANWLEVALFIIGLILLAVEVFILPGFGIAGILGIACIFAGLFGMLIKNPPDRLPWPETTFDWEIFTDGIIGMAIGFLGFMVAAYFLSRYLPKLQFMSGLVLVPSGAKEGTEMEISMTVPPESTSASIEIGDIGEVVSRLRPAGKAKFGDAIVDVLAEGEFLDRGTAVEIIEIHGNKVVVKKAGD